AVGLVVFSTAVRTEAGRTTRILGAAGSGVSPVVVGLESRAIGKLAPLHVLSGRLFDDGADDCVVSERFARSLGLNVGDRIEVDAPLGKAHLTVAGLVRDEGLARIQDAKSVVTSLATAQRIAGAPGGLTNVALDLRPGVDVEAWIVAHRPEAGPGLDLRDVESLLAVERQQIQGITGAFTAL